MKASVQWDIRPIAELLEEISGRIGGKEIR